KKLIQARQQQIAHIRIPRLERLAQQLRREGIEPRIPAQHAVTEFLHQWAVARRRLSKGGRQGGRKRPALGGDAGDGLGRKGPGIHGQDRSAELKTTILTSLQQKADCAAKKPHWSAI